MPSLLCVLVGVGDAMVVDTRTVTVVVAMFRIV
jgi:hypothetical protein